jgi:cell volume regulation protein A
VHQLRVTAGSHADGHTIGELNTSDVWVSFVVREGRLVPVSGDTRLHAGDEVMVLADPGLREELEAAFSRSP